MQKNRFIILTLGVWKEGASEKNWGAGEEPERIQVGDGWKGQNNSSSEASVGWLNKKKQRFHHLWGKKLCVFVKLGNCKIQSDQNYLVINEMNWIK